jgi:hypothetical protein
VERGESFFRSICVESALGLDELDREGVERERLDGSIDRGERGEGERGE